MQGLHATLSTVSRGPSPHTQAPACPGACEGPCAGARNPDTPKAGFGAHKPQVHLGWFGGTGDLKFSFSSIGAASPTNLNERFGI